MIQVTELSEDRLSEVAGQIGESFYDYPYEADEGGLRALIPSREAMDAYMKALVMAGIENRSFYATSEQGEGYVLLTDSFGGHPSVAALLKMLTDISTALGGWGPALTLFRAAGSAGETLEQRMKKKRRPYIKVEMLLVTKPYQGQGVMRRIMEFVFEKARELHASVILSTDVKGKCDRYLHLGMTLAGTRESAGFKLYDLIWEPERIPAKQLRERDAAVRAVVGTNSWGGKRYEELLRGNSVEESVIREAVQEGLRLSLPVFDTARDYGFGEGQRMIGRLCPPEAMISAKYTPGSTYERGQVLRSFEKDLQDFGREYVDIYWLHLPRYLDENLSEMIELFYTGRIGHIGVSNFNLPECRRAKEILDAAGVPLFGVQNHYSLLAREWEKNGLLGWCRENGVQFWAWAVLEEGMLVPPAEGEKTTVMKLLFRQKRRKLAPLYQELNRVGAEHGLTAAQVSLAYCASKGIVPLCGCRTPEQVRQLGAAADTILTEDERSALERAADETGVRVLGADMFRFIAGESGVPDGEKAGRAKTVWIAGLAAASLAGAGYRLRRRKRERRA